MDFMSRLMRLILVLVLSLTGSVCSFGQALPAAPGPYVPLSATETLVMESFGADHRVVATYYFYWYKWDNACAGALCDPAYNRAHIEFATGQFGSATRLDALTNHPTDVEQWNFEDPAWHAAQIDRIVSASINLVLPVFWGVPGRYDGAGGHPVAAWSKKGMEAFAAALAEREKQGKTNPKVGMFYDTSTLTFESPFNYTQGAKLDLTSEPGQKQFYATIRDFFSLIPPRHWAMWEGFPIVWLYAGEFASQHDDQLLPSAKERFKADFGGLEPMFVAHLDWEGANPEWIYRWGGAIQPSFLSVSSVGPGFDNSGAEGKPRGHNVRRDRAAGEFYKAAWERALRSDGFITVVETWNELHEGTEICPTREYGTEYLDITRRYAQRFRSGETVPPFAGPFSESSEVLWKGEDPHHGIRLVGAADGGYRLTPTDEGSVIEMVAPYLYFDIDDGFLFSTRDQVRIEVEYADSPNQPGRSRFGEAQQGSFHIEYDSWRRDGQYHGIYKTTEPASLGGSLKWNKHSFVLEAPRLANNQNEGADFRIVGPRGLRVRSVRVFKSPPAE